MTVKYNDADDGRDQLTSIKARRFSISFLNNRAFGGVERAHESPHIPHIDTPIPEGGQRTAGHKVDIRTLTADEQNPFSGIDAGVNF